MAECLPLRSEQYFYVLHEEISLSLMVTGQSATPQDIANSVSSLVSVSWFDTWRFNLWKRFHHQRHRSCQRWRCIWYSDCVCLMEQYVTRCSHLLPRRKWHWNSNSTNANFLLECDLDGKCERRKYKRSEQWRSQICGNAENVCASVPLTLTFVNRLCSETKQSWGKYFNLWKWMETSNLAREQNEQLPEEISL